MKKSKLHFKKSFRYLLLSMTIVTIILFSVPKTISRYNTAANISTLNAMPIINVESADYGKILAFKDYGWATYNFDVVNGKVGQDGLFYVNEIDMEYYIKVIQDSGELPLKLLALYNKSDLNNPLPYDEEKGFGPFDLPYKVDDELVFNPVAGYYESKYVSRVNYMLVYTYGTCAVGNTNCLVNASEAGKDYKFHIEIKAYQKVSG